MLFTQLSFLWFFVVVWTVYWSLGSNHLRKVWLLASSYFFYGYWDYRFLALIGFFTLLNFCAAALMDGAVEQRRKSVITCTVVGNLLILGFFKYFNFFVGEVWLGLQKMGLSVSQPELKIVLPVGISFITFQAMSFAIDTYRRQVGRQSLLDVALFIAFFPQLVAGPIVRATDLLDQFQTRRIFSEVSTRSSVALFLVGYFKKACVADNIAAAIDPIFLSPTAFDGPSRVLGAILYSTQIYCDFSGYTDMALATSALFGYQLIRNFDAPYLSVSIREFWQRWHMSLSTWLRDYLYIPLGGNRGSSGRVARNLMLTMILGGLWHGANWTFILWGALHGAALVVHRFFGRRMSFGPGAWGKLVAGALTFSWVVLCFTIFRAPDIETAWRYFVVPAEEGLRLWTGWWVIALALAGVHYLFYAYRADGAVWLSRVPRIPYCIGWGLVAGLLLYMTPLNLSAFIYFQF